MRFDSIDLLRKEGFEGFRSVKELNLGCSEISKEKGNYLVLYVKENHPDFLKKGVGGFFKGKDPNVSIDELESSWVDGTVVVYIGQTENSLRKRISQYVKFGQGKPVGHYGGRYIWQLQDFEDLLFCWLPCRNLSDNPREIESDLLMQFIAIYGKPPFANLPKKGV